MIFRVRLLLVPGCGQEFRYIGGCRELAYFHLSQCTLKDEDAVLEQVFDDGRVIELSTAGGTLFERATEH